MSKISKVKQGRKTYKEKPLNEEIRYAIYESIPIVLKKNVININRS